MGISKFIWHVIYSFDGFCEHITMYELSFAIPYNMLFTFFRLIFFLHLTKHKQITKTKQINNNYNNKQRPQQQIVILNGSMFNVIFLPLSTISIDELFIQCFRRMKKNKIKTKQQERNEKKNGTLHEKLKRV